MTATSPAIMWFRRDLRLRDNPALLAAAHAGTEVIPVFVLDDSLRKPAGAPRLAYCYRALRALDESMGGALVVRHGAPETVIPRLARDADAHSVHIAADYGPYGRGRDERVAAALDDVPLVATGSPYAVAPGRINRAGEAPYRVFSPFFRAWCRHGWREPAGTARWSWASGVRSDAIPADPALPAGLTLPESGERAALARWQEFLPTIDDYACNRDRPDRDATSRMSAYLKFGCVHPRTLLADLGQHTSQGAQSFRSELGWREFYADVLWRRPETAREYYNTDFETMAYDEPGAALKAWQQGRTGFPIVDAGMRQLLAEGWMHNRVRMIVASFLVKDCHVEWAHGARHFMRHLADGDLASNQHGWQWVAGCGTDAAPYFRIFNPVTQGKKFDPEGAYIRSYVRELADADNVHEPWTQHSPPAGYPAPIVDHATERAESLRRYQAIKRQPIGQPSGRPG